MYAPLPTTAAPARVLTLSRGESSVRVDMALLRNLGARAFVHHTRRAEAFARLLRCEENAGGARPQGGSAAAKKASDSRFPGGPTLDSRPFDVVLCDAEFEDGVAVDFLLQLAENPFLNSQPVLVIADCAEQADVLRRAMVGCLARPYTQQQMNDVLIKAMSPLRPRLAAHLLAAAQRAPVAARARSASKNAAQTMTTSDWVKRGRNCLRDNSPREAEAAFLRVLDRQDDHPEASLALAQIRLARGEGQGARNMVLRAAAGCLRRGEAERAESICALLPPHMRGNRLFVHEAQARMEEGEFRAAASGFLEARRENPGTPLHGMLARAAALTADPQATLEHMCEAYERIGRKATADALRKRLLHKAMEEAGERGHWLDKFPVLQEIVQVASYTARIWRHA